MPAHSSSLIDQQTCLALTVVDLFENSSLTLIFPSGSAAGTQRCTDIAIVDDTCAEPMEVFVVTLTVISADGVEIDGGMEQAMVSIEDNDGNKSAIYICHEHHAHCTFRQFYINCTMSA